MTARESDWFTTAAKIAHWLLVVVAAVVAWLLMTLAAIWQGPFIALLFPAGWCAFAAVRQYHVLRERM